MANNKSLESTSAEEGNGSMTSKRSISDENVIISNSCDVAKCLLQVRAFRKGEEAASLHLQGDGPLGRHNIQRMRHVSDT